MYAFAIADGDEHFLARDPVGIKPLYTGPCKGELIFTSEIKALPWKAAPTWKRPT